MAIVSKCDPSASPNCESYDSAEGQVTRHERKRVRRSITENPVNETLFHAAAKGASSKSGKEIFYYSKDYVNDVIAMSQNLYEVGSVELVWDHGVDHGGDSGARNG